MERGRGETSRWRRGLAVLAGCLLMAGVMLMAGFTLMVGAAPLAASTGPRPAPRAAAERGLEAQLLEDINTLASDDFAGREPGTEGEAKTLRWLGRQWFDAGLVSGTNDPGHPWFAPVALVAREPVGSALQFWRRGRQVLVEPGEALVLISDGVSEALDGSSALFGHERLRAALDGRTSATAMIEAVRDAVRLFEDGTDPTDDLTVMAVRYLG